ncbi:MAG: carboxypeptidase regulatory-like domain-containing protein [Candidatus Hydrogenedentes bacterium]|nr:carboxypeptidase regulatory-like domain-containing protein [Candidatus Hydrogenedentota bacterium]
MDASTGHPISGARVRLHKCPLIPHRTRTDSEGYFWMAVYVSGVWVLEIEKAGFASQTLEVRAEDLNPILVELTPL